MKKIVSASVLALVSSYAHSASSAESSFIKKKPTEPAIDYKIHYYASCVRFDFLNEMNAPLKESNGRRIPYHYGDPSDPHNELYKYNYVFNCGEKIPITIANPHYRNYINEQGNVKCSSDEITVVSETSLDKCKNISGITNALSEPFNIQHVIRYSICVDKGYMKEVNGGRDIQADNYMSVSYNCNILNPLEYSYLHLPSQDEQKRIEKNEAAKCSGDDVLLVSNTPIKKCRSLSPPAIVVEL